MRKRLVRLSANRLRGEFKSFEAYALQERFQSKNESFLQKTEETAGKEKERGFNVKRLSVAASAKRLETLAPARKNTKFAVQSSSVTRLYHGAIEDFSSSKVKINKDTLPDYSESEEFRDYLSGLQLLNGLQKELEMNYDVSKNSRAAGVVGLGLYYQIENDMKDVSNVKAQRFNTETLTAGLEKLTCYIREIIRVLRSKQLDDEASVMELMWRANVKLVDWAAKAMEVQAQEQQDEVKKMIERTKEECEEKMRKLEEKQANYLKGLRNKNKEMTEKIVELKKENKLLEDRINLKEGMLQELSEIDRFEVLRDTSKTLLNLSELLEEVTEEKGKQVKFIHALPPPIGF